MRAMVVKEFRELRRDRRTVAMIVALPILLLVVFGYAANFTVDSIETAALGERAEGVAAAIQARPDAPFDVVVVDPSGTEADGRELLRDNETDVAIVADGAGATALVDGSSIFAAQTALAAFSRVGSDLPVAVEVEVLFNPDLITAWVMIPAIIGLILMFIGTVVTSLGLVRERQAGTLEQLAVMPISPSAVIAGKIAPYFLLASIDMLLVTVLGMLLFDVPFNGNPAVFALGAALFLLVVLGIGVFVSTVSQNAGQAIQAALMFLLPQILLSGMIFPLEAIPWGVRWISYALPLTYFTMISQGVMIRGADIDSLLLPFAVLLIMAIVVFTGAVLRFRRSLAPALPDPPRGGAEAPVATPAQGGHGGSAASDGRPRQVGP